MNRGMHASALTGGVATALAVSILAVNLVWPSTPNPGAAAEVTPLTTPQTVAAASGPAPAVRDGYTVTSAPATTASTPAATTMTASGTTTATSGRSATAEALLCVTNEEAIPSGDVYACGPADQADPTIVPVVAPADSAGASDTRTYGAGVPAGVQLRVVHGDQTITTPGTVLDGLDIRGRVIVRAADVTIRNSIIRGNDGAGTRGGIVDAMTGAAGLKITDSEIAASVPNPYVNGIMGWNFELTRVNIHGTIDQVHIAGSNVAIRDSWLHGSLHYAAGVDPNHADGSHDDNIQIVGGSNITITGNVLSDSYNAAIMVGQDRSVIGNLTISGNRLDHGGCTVNIAEKGRGPLQAVTVSGNTFGMNTRLSRCGVIAPATTVISQSANAYTDGSAVTVRKG